MDESAQSRRGPESGLLPGSRQPAAAGPAHMNWDTSRLQSYDITLATATATPSEIIVNFGARRGGEDPNGEVTVELLRRIALKPLTAKHLADTLERLIAAYDAGTRR